MARPSRLESLSEGPITDADAGAIAYPMPNQAGDGIFNFGNHTITELIHFNISPRYTKLLTSRSNADRADAATINGHVWIACSGMVSQMKRPSLSL